MKTLLFTSLIILFGCSSEKKTQSKTCTMNGSPIDCAEFERRNQDPVTNPMAVSIGIDADISIDNFKITVLENAEAMDSVTSNGMALTCLLRLNTEQVITAIRRDDNSFVFRNIEGRGDSLTFNRRSGSGILGIWENEKQETSRLTMKTTIEISNGMIKIKRKCSYN